MFNHQRSFKSTPKKILFKQVLWVVMALVLPFSSLSADPTLVVSLVDAEIWDIEQNGRIHVGKIFKAPAESLNSLYGNYYLLPRSKVSFWSQQWLMFDKTISPSTRRLRLLDTSPGLTVLTLSSTYHESCFTAPYCYKNSEIMMMCLDSGATNGFISIWDANLYTNKAKNTAELHEEFNRNQFAPYYNSILFIDKDLSFVVIFGGVSPGQKFDIPNDNTDYSSYDFTSAPTLLTGPNFTVMDAYFDIEENMAYCVTEVGNLRIIDLEMTGSGNSQRNPISIETGQFLTAIDRSTNVKSRFLIGQSAGTKSTSFWSLGEIEDTQINSVTMADGLQVIVGGITSLQGQAAFFVITVDQDEYFTPISSTLADVYVNLVSEIQLLITLDRDETLNYISVSQSFGVAGLNVKDILSESPTEVMILTKTSVQVHTINFSMVGCDKSCRICILPGIAQCSSCKEGYEKSNSWADGDTKGTCVLSPKDCGGGVMFSNCSKCRQGKVSCEICAPGYGVKDKAGASNEEKECQKCTSDQVVNKTTHDCQDKETSLIFKTWSLLISIGMIFLWK